MWMVGMILLGLWKMELEVAIWLFFTFFSSDCIYLLCYWVIINLTWSFFRRDETCSLNFLSLLQSAYMYLLLLLTTYTESPFSISNSNSMPTQPCTTRKEPKITDKFVLLLVLASTVHASPPSYCLEITNPTLYWPINVNLHVKGLCQLSNEPKVSLCPGNAPFPWVTVHPILCSPIIKKSRQIYWQYHPSRISAEPAFLQTHLLATPMSTSFNYPMPPASNSKSQKSIPHLPHKSG